MNSPFVLAKLAVANCPGKGWWVGGWGTRRKALVVEEAAAVSESAAREAEAAQRLAEARADGLEEERETLGRQARAPGSSTPRWIFLFGVLGGSDKSPSCRCRE